MGQWAEPTPDVSGKGWTVKYTVSIANGGNSKKEGGATHDVDGHSPIKRHEEGA